MCWKKDNIFFEAVQHLSVSSDWCWQTELFRKVQIRIFCENIQNVHHLREYGTYLYAY